MEHSATYVIVGGGIAGVSCAEGLSFLHPDKTIILITASPLIKAVKNVVPLSKHLVQFDVEECAPEKLSEKHSSVTVWHDTVAELDSKNHLLHTTSGKTVSYKKLCICTGGRAKLIAENHPHVVSIRDTQSVKDFQSCVKNARRIVIVGNGGIATELSYELEGIEIIWVVKDEHITAAFVDPGAAEFFKAKLEGSKETEGPSQRICKRMRFTEAEKAKANAAGAALGPDWHANLNLRGLLAASKTVSVKYGCEVKEILNADEGKARSGDTDTWPVYLLLTNGDTVGCDLVVSATGVIPNSALFARGNDDLNLAPDGGITVDEFMQSSLPDVYAAGDVCAAGWPLAKHWFQMRLWTQARQMGMYAAKCMVASLRNEPILQDFCFEMFTHVTKFFGYKVVLLGLHNAQGLGSNCELLLRATMGVEYIKCVMQDGKMQGAVLIGETDLEEMCENLILDQLDLSDFGEALLDPNVDVEDYFD